jgi:hypothetical protein
MIQSPESSTMFLIRPIPVKHVVKNVHRITQQQKNKIQNYLFYILFNPKGPRRRQKNLVKKVSSSGINYNKLNNISMNRENRLISDLLISVSCLLFPEKKEMKNIIFSLRSWISMIGALLLFICIIKDDAFLTVLTCYRHSIDYFYLSHQLWYRKMWVLSLVCLFWVKSNYIPE